MGTSFTRSLLWSDVI